MPALFRRLRKLLRRPGDEGEGVLQLATVELRPQRPVERVALSRPVQVLACIARDPVNGQRLVLGTHVVGLARAWERRDIGVEALGEGQPLAVGGHPEFGGRLALHVGSLVATVQLDAAQGPLVLLLGGLEVDPVVVGPEVRPDTAPAEPLGLASVRGDAIEAGVARVERAAHEAARGLAVHHGAPLRRERRLEVVAGRRRDDPSLSAVGGDHAHRAQLVVVPRGVDDRATVPGERRVELEMLLLRRQAARLALRKVADVKMTQRLEHHPVARRGDLDPAQHLDVVALGRHLHGKAQRLDHALRLLDVEWDLRHRTALDVDAVDFPGGPEHDRSVVGDPGDVGVDAVHCPGFLQVAVQPVVEWPVPARFDVVQEQDRLEAHASHESQPESVGGGRRPHRAPGAGDERLDHAVLAIEPQDPVDLGVGVLVVLEALAGRGVPAEVDVAPVGREGGLAQILLVIGALVELQPLAAAPMVEPDLARAQRAARGEVLARGDELPVGTPRRIVEQAEIFLGHGRGVRAVPLHDPDVVSAAPVAGERDRLSVGAVARLHVPGESAGQGRGLTAADGHDIDVAQQIEDDLPAVGTHVEVHPGAGRGVDDRLVVVPGRIVDVPLVLFFPALLGLGGLFFRVRGQNGSPAPSEQDQRHRQREQDTPRRFAHRDLSDSQEAYRSSSSTPTA